MRWFGKEDDYPKALASWQIEHDAGGNDMTLEQEARFRAVRAAHGDAAVAGALGYCYWLARQGVWRDDHD